MYNNNDKNNNDRKGIYFYNRGEGEQIIDIEHETDKITADDRFDECIYFKDDNDDDMCS